MGVSVHQVLLHIPDLHQICYVWYVTLHAHHIIWPAP